MASSAVSKSLLVLIISAVVVFRASGYTVTCDTYDGTGCTNSGPFTFYYMGTTSTPNSQCNRNYRLRVSPLAVFSAKGFSCTFYMDVPHQSRYIYSIAEDATASWRTSVTPYIYGYGLHARVTSKSVSTSNYQYVDWYMTKAHTHPDDNHYSYAQYTIENSKVRVRTSAGHIMNGGSSYMFSPTSMYTWIGINRRSSATSAQAQGSGVCRVTCVTLPNDLFILPMARDQAPNSTTTTISDTDEPEVPAVTEASNQPGDEQEPALP